MKGILRLPRLLMGTVLLSLAAPIFAVQYTPQFRNCQVNNIGPNQWQAKFDLVIYVDSGSTAETYDNRVFIWLPRVTAAGLPTPADPLNIIAGWNNLTMTGSSVQADVSTSRIAIYSTSTTNLNIIRSGSSISVNFSTAGNGAYPGLWIRTSDYHSNGGYQISAWVLPNKTNTCYTGSSTPPPTTPPIDELEPPEPAFSLKSAVWELNTVDVADLPNVAASGTGYAASIKNAGSNNLCLNYTTAGVKDKTYALGVTNSASLQGGRNLFMMQNGGSQLPYNLQLTSNDGVTGNNFDFPAGTTKYITLSQAASSVDKRSEMCWTPKINLFKNASTVEGMHSDTLNFIITPKA